MVDLLQDFLPSVVVPEEHEGPSLFSGCVSSSCVFERSSPSCVLCMVGDARLVRGDLCGGGVPDFEDMHLFSVCNFTFHRTEKKRTSVIKLYD